MHFPPHLFSMMIKNQFIFFPVVFPLAEEILIHYNSV